MGHTMRTPGEPSTDVSLTVARAEEAAALRPKPRWTYLPWPVAALVWTLAAAAAGWIISAALPVAAWVAAARTPAMAVVDATGQMWLAAHGATAQLGGVMIGLPPLGMTLLAIAACGAAARHAAEQVVAPPDIALPLRWRSAAAVVGVCVATYTVAAVIASPIVGTSEQAVAAVAGAFVVSLLGSVIGAMVGLELDPWQLTPAWLARLPRAVGAGTAMLAAGSTLALIMAFVSHWTQVQHLHDSLGANGVGAAVLIAVQLAYAPTAVLWAGSFVLGAGIRLGPDGLLAPGRATVGTLPAIPAFGALPTTSGPQDWAWLTVGVLAGLAAGAVMVRRTTPTLLQAAWRGALSGLAAGALWAVASWFATGDLGARALVGLGPRFPDLWWLATLPLAAAGACGGLIVVAWRRVRAAREGDGQAG